MTVYFIMSLNLISVMAQRVKLKGLSEVENAIKKMAHIYTPEIIGKILTEEAKPMVETMRGLAPVHTGRLRKSIKILNRKNEKFKYTTLVGIDYAQDGKGTMTIPALASVIEYGARLREPKRGEFKRVKIGDEWVTMGKGDGAFASIPARPFIRPGYDMHKGRIAENIVKKLYELTQKKAKEEGFDAK